MDFIFHLYGLLDLFLCSIRQILTELSETRFLTPENFGKFRKFRKIHEIPGFTWSFHLTGPGWNSEIVDFAAARQKLIRMTRSSERTLYFISRDY